MTDTANFATRLLAWSDRHGRKDLPWHRRGDPYAVWIAEIMLQQTQVTTVIPYFERFVQHFPDIEYLANADLDEVLHLWTGLGYYARARNLHTAAKRILACHGGRFPQDFDSVLALPGIGRSTAGAILAFAFGQCHPILDGNVKRVITRYFRIEGRPGQRAVEKRLWALARQLTPALQAAEYNQAIMDLGATLCRRNRPHCAACPQARHCAAHRHGDEAAYPTPRPRKKLPEKAVAMVMIRNKRHEILLEQRPPTGIWGSLWSLPECNRHANVRDWCQKRLGIEIAPEQPWSTVRHTFSHFRLNITPVPARLVGSAGRLMENHATVWYNPLFPDSRGLAAPVKRLLEQMRKVV